MLIQLISPTDIRWQQYLDTVSHDFYHLPGYLNLEANRNQAIAEAILIKDGMDTFFLPYLIRNCCQIISSADREIYDVISPYGYPGMLVSQTGQHPNFIKKCWSAIHQHWQTRNICTAFIRLHPILNHDLDSWMEDIDRSIVCNLSDVVVCDLTHSLENLWQQTRKNHRTKINKLKRSGFTVRMVPVDRHLDVFIDIYQETMHRVNATSTYFFTRSYFEDLLAALGEQLNICIVEIDNQIVASSLITEVSGIIQYHLGGTRTKFLPQSPKTIMFDYIINWAKDRDNKYFNLGGGLGGKQDSLYHFKSGFSKETRSFATMKSIIDQGNYEYLTNLRAKFLDKPASEIKSSAFFPAYRSS